MGWPVRTGPCEKSKGVWALGHVKKVQDWRMNANSMVVIYLSYQNPTNFMTAKNCKVIQLYSDINRSVHKLIHTLTNLCVCGGGINEPNGEKSQMYKVSKPQILSASVSQKCSSWHLVAYLIHEYAWHTKVRKSVHLYHTCKYFHHIFMISSKYKIQCSLQVA